MVIALAFEVVICDRKTTIKLLSRLKRRIRCNPVGLKALFGFTNVDFTLDFSDIWSAIFV